MSQSSERHEIIFRRKRRNRTKLNELNDIDSWSWTHIHLRVHTFPEFGKIERETDLRFHLNFIKRRKRTRTRAFPVKRNSNDPGGGLWQLSIYTRNINDYNNDNTATACTAIDIVAKKFDGLETATCRTFPLSTRLYLIPFSLYNYIQYYASKKSYLLFGTTF